MGERAYVNAGGAQVDVRTMTRGVGQRGDAAHERRARRVRRGVEPGARTEGEHPPVLEVTRVLELLCGQPLAFVHLPTLPEDTHAALGCRLETGELAEEPCDDRMDRGRGTYSSLMTRRRQAISMSIALVVTLVAAAFWAQARGADTGHRSVDRSPSVADGSRVSVLDAYANLPLAFVENQGQTNTRVRYYAQGPRYGFFLTPDALVLSLVETPAPTEATIGPAGDGEQVSWQGVSLALQFVGANPDVKIEAEAPAAGEVSYLRGARPDAVAGGAGPLRSGRVPRPVVGRGPRRARDATAS